MTKRTPLERFQIAKEAALKDAKAECENTRRAMTDPDLSPGQRLEKFKRLQAWPRIVLGLYKAELANAQSEREKERKENRVPKTGVPSEIARDKVAEALGLSAERIRQLCREGTCHLGQGMPRRPEIRAAEFMRRLSSGKPF